MKSLFRKELANLKPYVPGKPIEEVQKEYGLDFIDKLASNENPLGPSPKAVEAIKREAEKVNLYPDAYAMELKLKLGDLYSLEHENIVLGNGGEQIISAIAQAFIDPGDEAIMSDLTFSLYETSVVHMGGKAVTVPLKGYKHDIEGYISKINDRTKLIFLCNPNNPTGNIATRDEVEYLVDNVPEDVVIVFDEAYYDYAKVNPDYPDTLEILRNRENIIILRTFSKVAGIAGVRVGFALTTKEIAREMNKVVGVFNVNRLAQAAALGALEDKEHIERTVSLNYQSLEKMEAFFKEKKLEYVPSNANFIFVDVNKDSRIVFEELLKRGIIVRPGYLWGWDNWLRISTGTLEQTDRLLRALEEII